MSTAAPTQANQMISVKTALGDDALLFTRFSGHEGMSRLFDFQVGVLSAPGQNVDFAALLGKNVTVKIKPKDAEPRFFSGICARVSQDDPEDMTAHTLYVVPKLWLLTQRRQCRVFQSKMVKEVLEKVLTGIDITWNLQGTYDPHNLIVQYHETDFDFASRLMEEEGIFYFFEHGDGSHKMVIADHGSHPPLKGPQKIIYNRGKDTGAEPNRIFHWEKSQEIRPTKYAVRDHSFELTGQELDTSQPCNGQAACGSVSHNLKAGADGDLEVYEYPGAFAHRFDGVESSVPKPDKNFTEQDRTARLRIDQESAGVLQISGASDCPYFASGYEFNIVHHPHADGAYCLTTVTHHAIVGGGYRSGGGGTTEYSNRFTCIPSALLFRPPRVTPQPVIHGLQSAVVTGPPGEEIYVDKYGRVRIQFHWDREGKKNDKSTCWVRVAQTWAGQKWGAFFWPRIGHEVLVAFMEGDPDQPVIVGSVYNNANMPPYTLPDHKTRSGIKTHSTLKGTDQNFNELRFEDKKDKEEIYLHAEKDLNAVIENNETRKIGFDKKDKGDQTVEIFNNQTLKVGNAQASDGSQTIEIWKDRTTTIAQGNDSLTIKMGNQTVNLKMGNQTTKLDLGASTTEAMQAIELKVGQSSIKIDQMGITMKGMMIKVEGTVMTDVKGLMTTVNGSAMLTVKGGLTMIN